MPNCTNRAKSLTLREREHYQKLKLELRRGVLILAVLAELREEHYGYSLRKTLSQKGLDIDEGTLYPLMRRLEKQQLLTSDWREENNRKKRFYQLSEIGITTLEQLTQDWQNVESTLNNILNSCDEK
jgi:PadR family transcriptional regulator PadR